jgi:hypothetical protein
MRSVPGRNKREMPVPERYLFCRTFHKCTIEYRLLGRQPASLFKHLGCDVDPNRMRDETRYGQRGMPGPGGYIQGLIALNGSGELQKNRQTRSCPMNVADRAYLSAFALN